MKKETILKKSIFTVSSIILLSLYACGGASGSRKLVNAIEEDKTVPKFDGLQSISQPVTDGTIDSSTGKPNYQVDLTWSPAGDNITPSNAIIYEICFATFNKCPALFISKASATGVTTTTITGLIVGKVYYFVVRAKDAKDNIEENTKVVTVAIDSTPPTFIGIQSATAQSGTQIELTWNIASDNISQNKDIVYEICYTDLSGGCSNTATAGSCDSGFMVADVAGKSGNASVSNNILSYTISSLLPNKNYYFVVRAKDEIGNCDESTDNNIATVTTTELMAKTLDSDPPYWGNGGNGLQLAAGSTPQTDVDLSWLDASDNPDPATLLKYDVYYFDNSPTMSSNFSVPNATVNDNTGTALKTTTTITGLFPNKTYYFMVRGKDSSGNQSGFNDDPNSGSPQGTIQSLTTAKETAVPTFPDVEAGLSGSESRTSTLGVDAIRVQWTGATDGVAPTSTADADIRYYIWQVQTAGVPNFGGYTVGSEVAIVSNTTIKDITGLSGSTRYCFAVKARDLSDNFSANTDYACSYTSDTLPPTFGGVTTATAGYNKVTLNWSLASDTIDPTSNLSYDIYYSTTSTMQNFLNAATSITNATTIDITGLTAGQQYFFVVRARDSSGNQETNTIEQSATVLIDSVAPTFAGLVATSVVDTTSIKLDFSVGATPDNVTTRASLGYYICASTVATDCATNIATYISDFITTGGTSIPATSTIIQIVHGAVTDEGSDNFSFIFDGLTTATQYYFVMRAVDEAGNIETNVVEKTATTN